MLYDRIRANTTALAIVKTAAPTLPASAALRALDKCRPNVQGQIGRHTMHQLAS